MLFTNFNVSHRQCVNILQGVKKNKQQCNVKVTGRQPAQTCLEKAIFFKCWSALGLHLSCFCWLASIKMACKENCHCCGPGWIDDFIAQCLVHSRCSTWMSYPGSSGCGPKGHEGDCRPLSRILCVLICAIVAPNSSALRCNFLLWGIYFYLQELSTLCVCYCPKVT